MEIEAYISIWLGPTRFDTSLSTTARQVSLPRFLSNPLPRKCASEKTHGFRRRKTDPKGDIPVGAITVEGGFFNQISNEPVSGEESDLEAHKLSVSEEVSLKQKQKDPTASTNRISVLKRI